MRWRGGDVHRATGLGHQPLVPISRLQVPDGGNARPCCSLEQFGLPKQTVPRRMEMGGCATHLALARCSPRRHPLTHPAGVWPCNSPTEIAGSAGRIRTYDQPVNSRLLYR
jgi:hypothetical protein